MNRLIFAFLAAALFNPPLAHAGVYFDRLRDNNKRAQAQKAEADAESILRQQAELRVQIGRFAAKHAGLKDAGDCGPATTENCTFLAICVPMPVKRLTVAELGSVRGARIDQCEVTLGDGSVCSLTNDFDVLWQGRRDSDHVPSLKANCLDARSVSHETFQF